MITWRLCIALILAIGASLRAQDAPQPAPSTLPALTPRPNPAQAVVFEVNRPWLTAADWDGNTPPAVFGMSVLRDAPREPLHPRFTLADANANALWVYRLGLPIEISKYPMLSMRYRATNTSQNAKYILRLVYGNGEDRTRLNVFSGSDVVNDGQPHDLEKDLRELGASDSLLVIGIGLASNDQGNATFDLIDLRFSAPGDTSNEVVRPERPMQFLIVDTAGNSVKAARVTIDAERRNFARPGRSRNDGTALAPPMGNESGKHMLRVEADGFVPVELTDIEPDENNQPAKITMQPARFYGGVLRDDAVQAIANARISIRPVKERQVDNVTLVVDHNVVTDSRGRWESPPLPDDRAMFTIGSARKNGGATEVRDALPDAAIVSAATLDELRQKISEVDGGVAYARTEQPQPSTSPTSPTSAPAVARAAPTSRPATIQLADDSSVTGELLGLRNGKISVAGKSIDMRDVTEIGFPPGPSSAAPRPSTGPSSLRSATLQLVNGDKFLANINGWSDQRLVIQLATNPSMKFDAPVNQLAELWCAPADQIKKAKALNEPAGLEDIAFATKDNQILAVHGLAVGFDGDFLVFRFNGQDRKLALVRLVGVIFARQELPADDTFEQIVQFGADQTISGSIESIAKGTLSLRTRAGVSIGMPMDAVLKITNRNGRAVFLSDLKPASVEQVPYFDRMLTYRVDQSLDGKPLVLKDGTYKRGIAVHSRCALGYDLGGKFDEFRAKVGFQQPEGKLGEAVVRVLGDGKVLFEQPDARGDQPPFEVKVKLAGVQRLTLEVDFGKGQDVGDRVVWANPRLLRASAERQP